MITPQLVKTVQGKGMPIYSKTDPTYLLNPLAK